MMKTKQYYWHATDHPLRLRNIIRNRIEPRSDKTFRIVNDNQLTALLFGEGSIYNLLGFRRNLGGIESLYAKH